MRKIYDCFLFFNELDLLELRLNILDDYVDYFVLAEASVTHSGLDKPYYFEDNKKRYSKFLHKIIHVKSNDIPNDFNNLPSIGSTNAFDDKAVKQIHDFINTQTHRFNRTTEPHFGRDFFQKESIRRGLMNCNDEDIILSSDLDEIPNPEILKQVDEILSSGKFFTFNQTTYYYYLNLLKEYDWQGTRMGKYGDLKNYSYNELRAQQNIRLSNGGWHFSFQGGLEKVKTKIKSYSHQEMNTPDIFEKLHNNIENNIDPFNRGLLNLVEIDNTYPKYLLENKEKYKHMIKS